MGMVNDSPMKHHHLLKIPNQSPQLVSLCPPAVSAPMEMGIHGILTTGAILNPTVSFVKDGSRLDSSGTRLTNGIDMNGDNVVTSTAYFPVSHLQCQPTSVITTTIPAIIPMPQNILINAKYVQNQQLPPPNLHVLHANNEQINHNSSSRYPTATIRGKFNL